MEIIKYNSSKRKEWNDFLNSSKNGTFLLNRDFIEYHSDRFIDYSLMFYNKKTLVALLPLNIDENNLFSHGGLTYGGFIVSRNITTVLMLDIFEKLLSFLKVNKIKKLVFKSIPHIYHKIPSEEESYCLFRYNFSLLKREISSTINMKTTNIRGKKMNGYRKAIKLGLKINETSDCSSIITIVNSNLNEKYNTKAVHTADELNSLKLNFKNEIKFLNLEMNNEIEGGAILFLANDVVHAQYVTTSKKAKQNRAIDFIIGYIHEQFRTEFKWFDFGISTEKNGLILNKNLIKSKEEFGLSGICYDTYELNIM